VLASCNSGGQPPSAAPGSAETSNGPPALDLSPSQLSSVTIASVGTYEFPIERETVGNISFADDLSVQVFPAYQGTIINAFVELGADVLSGAFPNQELPETFEPKS